MIEKTFFIISDITGYTMYLTQSELDHAQEILKTLFDGQIQHAQPPVRISNFQGDAIFMYMPEADVTQEQTLLELVEQIYFSFERQLDFMRFHNLCSCRACSNMRTLDLKLFIHYGQCIVQKLGDREELIGSDVILVHRMMKNSVRETTGVQAYALFTDAAAGRLNLKQYCDDLIEHSETYEHIGEVPMYVHSLDAAWERERKKRRELVRPEDAWIFLEADLPGPPALIWDYFTNADLKLQWAGLDVEERIDDLGGRVKEGAAYHCAHGDMQIYYTVVDWNPFEHLTVRQAFPGMPELLQTYALVPVSETVTRASFYCARPEPDVPEEVREQIAGLYSQALEGLKLLLGKRTAEIQR